MIFTKCRLCVDITPLIFGLQIKYLYMIEVHQLIYDISYAIISNICHVGPFDHISYSLHFYVWASGVKWCKNVWSDVRMCVLAADTPATKIAAKNLSQQENPRGSIVEPQGLHQDGLNLKTPIIIAHVYDIF